MTDIPSMEASVPRRLGVAARYEDGELILDLASQPATLHHGILRASVISFAVDAVAGIAIDGDPDRWTFTTDMSIRMRPVPAPDSVSAVNTILRAGRRTVTSMVEVTSNDGAPIATGALGFATVPRKPDDPPKPVVLPDQAPAMFAEHYATLDQPVRDAAGIEVIDAAEGIVQIEVTPAVRNPARTLQGAMVALVAEAATEDLIEARFGQPCVVTDLDLRYVGQAQVGPVRTRTRLLGTTADAPLEVALVDQSTDKVTTLVYTRAAAIR